MVKIKMTYSKILIGVDGSDDSIKTIKRAKEFYKASDGKAKIVVFHSIEHHMIPPPTAQMNLLNIASAGIEFSTPISIRNNYDTSYGEIREHFTKMGQGYLNYIKELFQQDNVPIQTRLVEDIKPEDYIIRKVKEEGYDLVILGCKGHHSKFRRVLLGTVAEKTLNSAECDVLVIR